MLERVGVIVWGGVFLGWRESLSGLSGGELGREGRGWWVISGNYDDRWERMVLWMFVWLK